MWRREQPDDFDEVAAALQGPSAKALLVVCAHSPPKGNDVASRIVTSVRSIVVPPLSSRVRELRRITGQLSEEVFAHRGLPEARFPGEYQKPAVIGRRQLVDRLCGVWLYISSTSLVVSSRQQRFGLCAGLAPKWLAHLTPKYLRILLHF